MEPELSSVERLALRQLWNGTYVQAVDGSDDHLMNRLKREYEFVAWSGGKWVLTDKGRAVGEKLARGGNHFEVQADRITDLQTENARLRKQIANVKRWAYLYSIGDYTADDVFGMIEAIQE